MKNGNKKQVYLFVGIGLLLFCVMIFLMSGFGSFGKKSAEEQMQEILRNENQGTGFEEDTNPILEQKNDQSSQVMTLLNKVPYNGTNFSLFYSYDGNFFTLYINPSNPTAGNEEFNAFLKINGIDNRSWIYDLRTVSAKPTPESL